MRGKQGSEKYYILISLAIGVMVLGISLYLIFNEFFTENDASYEVCRQSVLLRAKAFENAGTELAESVIEEFPFRCTNEVLTPAPDLIEKEIADAMASCWSLYGEGRFILFSGDVVDADKHCFVCSRVEIEQEVLEKHLESKSEIIDMGRYLSNTEFRKGLTYEEYFKSRGGLSFTDLVVDISKKDVFIMYEYIEGIVAFGDRESSLQVRELNTVQDYFETCNSIETLPA